MIDDMPETVLDGVLGDVTREHLSDFPRAYAWLAVLAIASVLVPHSTSGLPRANLFCLLAGSKASGKSSACEKAFYKLSLEDAFLLRHTPGSGEGLIENIGLQEGAPRLIYPGELAQLLTKCNVEGSTLANVFNDAFYTDYQSRTVTKRKFVSMNARLSILGTILDEDFGEAFGSISTNGLYDRFLLGLCPSDHLYLWRPWEDEPRPNFGEVMLDLDEIGGSRDLPVVGLAPSALAERDRWVKELGIKARVAELALRSAIVCASFSKRDTLTADMMGPSLVLAEYQTKIRTILTPNIGENPDAKSANKILAFLGSQVAPGEFIKERDLARAINYHRFGPGVYTRVLHHLVLLGELERGKVGKVAAVRIK